MVALYSIIVLVFFISQSFVGIFKQVERDDETAKQSPLVSLLSETFDPLDQTK